MGVDDDCASHSRMDGTEILVLASCSEFVGKNFVRIEGLRSERMVDFSHLVRFLVLVDPGYLRTGRGEQNPDNRFLSETL